jgi:hypothetical protein
VQPHPVAAALVRPNLLRPPRPLLPASTVTAGGEPSAAVVPVWLTRRYGGSGCPAPQKRPTAGASGLTKSAGQALAQPRAPARRSSNPMPRRSGARPTRCRERIEGRVSNWKTRPHASSLQQEEALARAPLRTAFRIGSSGGRPTRPGPWRDPRRRNPQILAVAWKSVNQKTEGGEGMKVRAVAPARGPLVLPRGKTPSAKTQHEHSPFPAARCSGAVTAATAPTRVR